MAESLATALRRLTLLEERRLEDRQRRDDQLLIVRDAGATFEQIGQAVGTSRQYAFQLVRAARNRAR